MKGIPMPRQASSAQRRELLLSSASITTSAPDRISALFVPSRKTGQTAVSTAELTAPTRSAAASALGLPRASSVALSCLFMLFSSKTSPSTRISRPTPTRARISIIQPPSPPQPATAAHDSSSSACPSSPRAMTLRSYLDGQSPARRAAISASRALMPQRPAASRHTLKGTTPSPFLETAEALIISTALPSAMNITARIKNKRRERPFAPFPLHYTFFVQGHTLCLAGLFFHKTLIQ